MTQSLSLQPTNECQAGYRQRACALLLVDDQSRREGETRSGLLARAALDYIGRHKVA